MICICRLRSLSRLVGFSRWDLCKSSLPHHYVTTRELLFPSTYLFLGKSTCAFDIIRLVVFVRMPQVLDQTWVNLPPSMWLDLEVSVALLCACLPVMRPLLAPKKFWRNNRGSNRMTSGGSNSPDGKEKMMLEERTPERDAHSSSTTEDSGKIV